MSTIAENIANIRARMNEAAKKAGRDPSEILLCAATKMNDADRVKEAVAAGVDCCGENRVQEIQAKRPLGAYTGKPLHFIGHLQTNKVKYLVGVVDLIESVDRLELLECIEKQAEKVGVVQNILFEVNIGAEESKSGFTKEEAAALAARMREFPHVALKGLMAIPPVSEFPGENCRYFAEMRNLFVDIKAKKYDNVSMECLSMGMSDDFTDADFDEFDDDARPSRPSRSSTAPKPSYSGFDLDNDDLSSSGSSSNTGRRTLGGSNASNGKVVNIHTTAQMQVVLVKPDRFDNVSDIAEHLRSKHAVVLNLESTNKDVARRLVDFLSGCAYALDGKIKKIAISTYIITPYNVDIVGDLIDELENNGVYL